ncbi:hypothetical protein FRB99_005944 [Tulasnella sp. 403]|nr:hypothetical protein FRB99_005944 [Tulasnella sp. 403]
MQPPDNDLFPLSLVLCTTPGLEDYATESILTTLRTVSPPLTDAIVIDASLSSEHVILRFPAADPQMTPSALLSALDLCAQGKFLCVKETFIGIGDMVLEEAVRGALQNDWREEDLRKNETHRRSRKKLPWGSRSHPDDLPPPREFPRKTRGASLSPSEQKFVEIATGMVGSHRHLLSLALNLVFPSPTRYTFRASSHNPQHVVPFPFLFMADFERMLGEVVSSWLDHDQVESRGGWELLCQRAEEQASTSGKIGRLWKVDLKDGEVDVGVRLVSVLPSPTWRRLDQVDTPPRCGRQEPRQQFPSTIRLLLVLKVPNKSQTPRQGRTALSPVTAHLLSKILPPFSPFIHTSLMTALIMDPCAGTGSIPQALLRLAEATGIHVVALNGDCVLENIFSATSLYQQPGRSVEGILWTAEGKQGGIRDGILDGIVSGQSTFQVSQSPSQLTYEQVKHDRFAVGPSGRDTAARGKVVSKVPCHLRACCKARRVYGPDDVR